MASKKGVKNVEVDGIPLAVDKSVFDDIDFAELIATTTDDESTDAEKLVATVKLMKMALGPEYERVKGELRGREGGKLTAERMASFVTSVIEAAGAKN